MKIRFFDDCRLPFRSFSVKIVDRNGITHQVQFNEFSYFTVYM